MISAIERNVEVPAVLTADQVAQVLQISVRGFRGMVASGQFPQPIRLGRLTRWSRAAVDRWVEAQSQ